MRFEKGAFYHIYNRSNNNEALFPLRENYRYFFQKCETYLRPYCAVLAYCLMPTHFHFLVRIETDDSRLMSNQFAILLRSYTRAINKRFARHGNLFQQNTKAKRVDDESYLLLLMNYIHQNPVRAGLVNRPANWEFSSYRDHARIRNGTIVDRTLMTHYFQSPEAFVQFSLGISESAGGSFRG